MYTMHTCMYLYIRIYAYIYICIYRCWELTIELCSLCRAPPRAPAETDHNGCISKLELIAAVQKDATAPRLSLESDSTGSAIWAV